MLIFGIIWVSSGYERVYPFLRERFPGDLFSPLCTSTKRTFGNCITLPSTLVKNGGHNHHTVLFVSPPDGLLPSLLWSPNAALSAHRIPLDAPSTRAPSDAGPPPGSRPVQDCSRPGR